MRVYACVYIYIYIYTYYPGRAALPPAWRAGSAGRRSPRGAWPPGNHTNNNMCMTNKSSSSSSSNNNANSNE